MFATTLLWLFTSTLVLSPRTRPVLVPMAPLPQPALTLTGTLQPVVGPRAPVSMAEMEYLASPERALTEPALRTRGQQQEGVVIEESGSGDGSAVVAVVISVLVIALLISTLQQANDLND